MTLKECYVQCGGDYESTVERLCSERLVARFVLKFLEDGSYAALCESIAARDGEASFRTAHTLKGIALNLGLNSLFDPLNALTELLRVGWNDAAPELLPPVTAAYQRIAEAIRAWQANNPA